MSSRRKKNQGEANSSNRNLDGRRLRTVTEAKALAEYLALKPEMEKKEKEARRKRWEQVVDLAEKKEDEIRNGSKGRVDGKWVEEKEEAGERARQAVLAAMSSGDFYDNLNYASSGSSGGGSAHPSEGSGDDVMGKSKTRSSTIASATKPAIIPPRSYFGFDEDDDFMSDEEENEVDMDGDDGQGEATHAIRPAFLSKGKGTAKVS